MDKLHARKVWRKDRSEYAATGAKAFKINDYIDDFDKNRTKTYASSKTIRYDEFQKQTLGFSVNSKFQKIVRKPNESKKQFERRVERAMYVDVSPKSAMRIHSKFPGKIGRRPTTAFGPSLAQIMFFKEGHCPINAQKDFPEEDVCIKGGFSGSLPHFRNFGGPAGHVVKSMKRTKSMYKHVIARFPIIRELNIPHVSSIWTTIIKPTSGSGGDTSFFYTFKRYGWSSCCKTASYVWQTVSKQLTPNWSIYTCGDRAKRNKDKVAGDILECRLVLMQDFVEYLVARPFTLLVENLLTLGIINCPIVIGKSTAGEGYHDLVVNDKIYPLAAEIDWSLYDSSIPADKIIGAFALIRGLFPVSDAVDNLFCYFCSGLLNKYIAQADGNVYQVKRGLPSGSVWTTLVNSFVNCLLCEEAIRTYRPLGGKEFNYNVSGDDGKIFFVDPKVSFNKDKFIEFCYKKFKMKLKVRMFGAPIASHPDDSCEFLKNVLYFDGDMAVPCTPLRSLATRLACPQTDYKNYNDIFNFIFVQSQSLVNHKDCVDLVANYLAYFRIANSREGNYSFEYLSDEMRCVVKTTVADIYFNVNVPDVFVTEKVKYGERVIPFKLCEAIPPFDPDFVENWLYDNLYNPNFGRPTLASRIKWFKVVMGQLESCAVLFNDIWVRRNKNLKKYRIRGSLIKAIANIYLRYSGLPSGDVYRLLANRIYALAGYAF